MKYLLFFLSFTAVFFSCKPSPKNTEASQLVGTWKLVTATIIDGRDTTRTDYTGDLSFIKIINPTHFAFLQHNTKANKDTTFTAGGGQWKLDHGSYTESLEYCSDRAWEGHDFSFTVSLKGDTLVQTGLEKIEAKGINRLNTEIYVRFKP